MNKKRGFFTYRLHIFIFYQKFFYEKYHLNCENLFQQMGLIKEKYELFYNPKK